ncbi:hypothetical protein FIV42_15075 [Persicimonas caeni]|uniref:Cytochrome C Planctomycete-type domain-containing protein n=1 Tax=Persicimonas caeni TaxID=2292766 RepID=A0A4Y6PUJ1_PERCE|nr:c-type cytochrome domain-containing protein [Persicimonas caeni]QDG52014.1 hypothetical protein FIV42_15075 [Persicimonas caeni]QED33235.1 hypothetical protein FRD00_15070 [Persicimonas caeni]
MVAALVAAMLAGAIGCSDSANDTDPSPDAGADASGDVTVRDVRDPQLPPTFPNVADVIRRNCASGACHGGRGAGNFYIPHNVDATNAEVRYALQDVTSRKWEMPLIEPGVPAESEVFLRITSQTEGERMPQEPRDRLLSWEIEMIENWIANGALYEE